MDAGYRCCFQQRTGTAAIYTVELIKITRDRCIGWSGVRLLAKGRKVSQVEILNKLPFKKQLEEKIEKAEEGRKRDGCHYGKA